MQIESLHATHTFLSVLGSCQEEFQDSDLLGRLHYVLAQDGYAIQQLQEVPHRFLRGLAEEEGEASGGNFLVSVFMVILCIVCAGFASGLTQVKRIDDNDTCQDLF